MTSPFSPVTPNPFRSQSAASQAWSPPQYNSQNDPNSFQGDVNQGAYYGGSNNQYVGGNQYSNQGNQGQYYANQSGNFQGGYAYSQPGYAGNPNQYQGNGGYSQPNDVNYGSNPALQMFQNFGSSDQFSALASNPIAQIGISQASQFVSNMNDSYFSRWAGSLRYYFSVNNSYVLTKLKILLCPFLHKSWSRRIVPAADNREMYLPPTQDVNSPDLYIPSMAFITYILLISLIMATSNAGFKPDVLGMTASSGLITLTLEVLLIKVGFYLLSYPPVLVLDLVCYCGYKFVGIIIILLAGWLGGWLGFLASFVVLALFMAIFMVKTLRLIVPQPLEAGPKNVRNYVLISIAILQGIFTGILCWMDSKNQTRPNTI